ncbi:MAG TPA: patatin-like phospholipase family protein [Thermoleophilaceae bacterium]|nr:patatin-like phospholipase family protein [Thermoleophilaceae bacterium]
MRVGLVLGAGGVLGGAWLTGGLDALASETGWDPASADHVVGTSAGSMIGALCASGVPPWFMVAHSSGERFEGLVDREGRPASEAARNGGADFRLHRGLPYIGPGSWRLGIKALASPSRHTPAQLVCGWLPRGLISTEPLERTVRRVVPHGWSDHPDLWIVACDYETGRRVPFGRESAPPAELAKAVAASCAIPGFYRPVDIGGRSYVDGGVYSASNLDILRREGLDVVICLNPTSTRARGPARSPAARAAAAVRAAAGRRLGREARKLREAGTQVVLVQPTAEDIAIMGSNLMSGRRRHEVVELARRTVRAQLRKPDTAAALEGLPPGAPERIARPEGPPSEWSALLGLGVEDAADAAAEATAKT